MNYPERKNILLTRLASKELTMEQFLYECALWGMETECWIDIEVRQYPLPPKEWQEYLDLPLYKRFKTPENFFHQLPIKEYLYMKSKIYAENWADYFWIKEYKTILPDNAEHLQYHTRLDEKLIEFGYFFRNSNAEKDKILDTFEAMEV